jgi:hypothetical protein
MRALPAALALALACSPPSGPAWLEHAGELQPGAHVDGVWCSERIGPAIAYSNVVLGSVEARGYVQGGDLAAGLSLQLRAAPDRVVLLFPRAGTGTRLDVTTAPRWDGYAVEAQLRDALSGELLCELAEHADGQHDAERVAHALRAELGEKLGQGLPTL